MRHAYMHIRAQSEMKLSLPCSVWLKKYHTHTHTLTRTRSYAHSRGIPIHKCCVNVLIAARTIEPSYTNRIPRRWAKKITAHIWRVAFCIWAVYFYSALAIRQRDLPRTNPLWSKLHPWHIVPGLCVCFLCVLMSMNVESSKDLLSWCKLWFVHIMH